MWGTRCIVDLQIEAEREKRLRSSFAVAVDAAVCRNGRAARRAWAVHAHINRRSDTVKVFLFSLLESIEEEQC